MDDNNIHCSKERGKKHDMLSKIPTMITTTDNSLIDHDYIISSNNSPDCKGEFYKRGYHHRRSSSGEETANTTLSTSTMGGPRKNRIMSNIVNGEWDAVMNRIMRCPGEASEWVDIPMYYYYDGSADNNDSCNYSRRNNHNKEMATEYVSLLPLHVCCLQSHHYHNHNNNKSNSNNNNDNRSEAMATPLDVIEALMEADGESVALQDASGRLPLHWACESHYSVTGHAHADNNHKNNNTENNDEDKNSGNKENTHVSVLELLLTGYPEGAQVKEKRHGFLPLHIAAAACNSNNSTSSNMNYLMMEALLKCHPKGARQKDDQGWLPLAVACHGNAGIDVIQCLLLSNPHAVTVVDTELRTPLHIHLAASIISSTQQQQHEVASITKLLIEANPSSLRRPEHRFGFLPLHVACSVQQQHYDNHNSDNESFSLQSSTTIVHTLLSHYPEAAQQMDQRHKSLPLHIACRAKANVSVIQNLLRVFPLGAKHLDCHNRIPLHWACSASSNTSMSRQQQQQQYKVIRDLLEVFPQGAQIQEDKYHYLPLHVACLHIHHYTTCKDNSHSSSLSSSSIIAADDQDQPIILQILNTLLAAYPGATRQRDCSGRLPLHIICQHASSLIELHAGTAILEGIFTALLDGNPTALHTRDGKDQTPHDILVEQRQLLLNKNNSVIRMYPHLMDDLFTRSSAFALN